MTVLKFSIFICCSLIGVAAFITFLILQNYASAVWAIIAGIINAIVAHLHWLNYKNNMSEWYLQQELCQLMYAGFVFFTVGTMGFVYHITIEILTKQPMLPVKDSIVIQIIWAYLTLKSGATLFYYAYKYAKNQNTSLIAEENGTETVE